MYRGQPHYFVTSYGLDVHHELICEDSPNQDLSLLDF
jgi:hypothetical protein